MRILLVEDCPVYRFVLSAALNEVGFVVDDAVDGVEALEHLAAEAPDLILTDINMPRMNGIDFIAAARQTLNGRDTPIFVHSSDKDPAKFERAAACGVEAWIGKPADLPQIARALRDEAMKAAGIERAVKSAETRLMMAAA